MFHSLKTLVAVVLIIAISCTAVGFAATTAVSNAPSTAASSGGGGGGGSYVIPSTTPNPCPTGVSGVSPTVAPPILPMPQKVTLVGIIKEYGLEGYAYKLEIGANSETGSIAKTVALWGNLDGIEEYIDKMVTAVGYLVVPNGGIVTITGTPVLDVVELSPFVRPTALPTPTPINVSVVGVVQKSTVAGYDFQFISTENTTKFLVVLTGNTKGLEQYIGRLVKVNGYIVSSASNVFARVLCVVDYLPYVIPNPTVKPTPSPSVVPVVVSVVGVVKKSDVVGFDYYLMPYQSAATNISVKPIALLTGEVSGLLKYLDKPVRIKGLLKLALNSYGVRVIEVLSFEPYVVPVPSVSPKPTPTPTPAPTPAEVKLVGTVQKSDLSSFSYMLQVGVGNGLVLASASILPPKYYYLSGAIDGLDKYLGQQVVVKGVMLPITAANSATTALMNVLQVKEFYPLNTLPSVPVVLVLKGTIVASPVKGYSYMLSLNVASTEANTSVFLVGDESMIAKYLDKLVYVKGVVKPQNGSDGSKVMEVKEIIPYAAPSPTDANGATGKVVSGYTLN